MRLQVIAVSLLFCCFAGRAQHLGFELAPSVGLSHLYAGEQRINNFGVSVTAKIDFCTPNFIIGAGAGLALLQGTSPASYYYSGKGNQRTALCLEAPIGIAFRLNAPGFSFVFGSDYVYLSGELGDKNMIAPHVDFLFGNRKSKWLPNSGLFFKSLIWMNHDNSQIQPFYFGIGYKCYFVDLQYPKWKKPRDPATTN